MKKTIKIISKIILILLAIIGAIFIVSAVALYYFVKDPAIYNEILIKKAKNGISYCQKQPQEQQSRCFAIVATDYNYNEACNFAPDKQVCTDLIGKVK